MLIMPYHNCVCVCVCVYLLLIPNLLSIAYIFNFLLCNCSNDKLKEESNMEVDLQKSLSSRLNRRGDRSNQNPQAKGQEGLLSSIFFF